MVPLPLQGRMFLGFGDPHLDRHLVLQQGEADRQFFDRTAGERLVIDRLLARAADLQEDVAALQDRMRGQRQALVRRDRRVAAMV